MSISLYDTPQPPAFAEPWHAQLFALTVHLNEQGRFTWPDWATCFGAELKARGHARELDGGDDYFEAWLAALETFLIQRGLAETETLASLKTAWQSAYLTTPHGQPVHLDLL
jgi:nitrile hydratase accessory protein